MSTFMCSHRWFVSMVTVEMIPEIHLQHKWGPNLMPSTCCMHNKKVNFTCSAHSAQCYGLSMPWYLALFAEDGFCSPLCNQSKLLWLITFKSSAINPEHVHSIFMFAFMLIHSGSTASILLHLQNKCRFTIYYSTLVLVHPVFSNSPSYFQL